MSLEEWLAIGVPDKVADEAMQWIAKLDSGDLEAAEQEAFQAWLSADLTHLWAFEELSEFWAKANFLESQTQKLPAFPSQPDASVPHPVSSGHDRYGHVSGLAIGFIAFGLIASFF